MNETQIQTAVTQLSRLHNGLAAVVNQIRQEVDDTPSDLSTVAAKREMFNHLVSSNAELTQLVRLNVAKVEVPDDYTSLVTSISQDNLTGNDKYGPWNVDNAQERMSLQLQAVEFHLNLLREAVEARDFDTAFVEYANLLAI